MILEITALPFWRFFLIYLSSASNTMSLCVCTYIHILSKFFLIVFWLKQNLQTSNILLTVESGYDLQSQISPGSGLILHFHLEHLDPNRQNRRNTQHYRRLNSHRTKWYKQGSSETVICAFHHDSTDLIVRFHLNSSLQCRTKEIAHHYPNIDQSQLP